MNKFSGEKYSLKIVEKMLSEIETIASNKSYEFVNANIDEKIKDNKIKLIKKILDDQPNDYISKIKIFGNNVNI